MHHPTHLALTITVLALITAAPVPADEAADDEPTPTTALTGTMNSLAGEPVDLAGYRGKVVLIVNTASKCGHTKQYKDLQALHDQYAEQGLAVLGFPCNQFGRQEPGTAEDIAAFCEKKYGVTFDLFEKIAVKGDDAAPLFRFLTSDATGLEDTGPVKWNFEKFLIARDGRVLARYRSKVKPSSEAVTTAIETALAEPVPTDPNPNDQ